MSMELDLSAIPNETNELSELDYFAERVTGDIERLRELRRNVWTMRNRKQLICSLPSEVLLKIFLILRSIKHECILSGRQYSPNRGKPKVRWDWTDVTKVCRLWRELAVGYAPLWNILFYITDLKKAHTFLERSMQSDLEVFCNVKEHYEDSSLSKLNQNDIARLRKLNICFLGLERTPSSGELGWWFSEPMPKLKEICITGHTYDATTTLLDGWVPDIQLDVVDLSCLGLAWNHPIFNNLRELYLSDLSEGPSVTEMLTILENCSARLQRLSISSIQFRIYDTRDHLKVKPAVVHLPNLQKFDLKSVSLEDLNRDGCFELLEGLDLVVNADSEFFFAFPSSSSSSILSTRIPDTWGRFFSDRQIGLLFFNDHVRLEVDQDSALRKSDGNTLLKVLFYYVRYPEEEEREYEALVTAVLRQKCIRDASNINLRLHLERRDSELTMALKKSLWIEIFESIPGVARIEVTYGDNFDNYDLESFDGFVSALMESELSDDESQAYRCSNLEEIALEHVDLSVAQVPEVLWKLKEYLTLRAESGKKLQKPRLALRDPSEEIKEAVSNFSDIVDEFSFEPFQSNENANQTHM